MDFGERKSIDKKVDRMRMRMRMRMMQGKKHIGYTSNE
jgi:hypothetical protein